MVAGLMTQASSISGGSYPASVAGSDAGYAGDTEGLGRRPARAVVPLGLEEGKDEVDLEQFAELLHKVSGLVAGAKT